jgi:hypothetical protein
MAILKVFVGLLLLSLPVLVLVWGFRTCRALWRQGITPWGRLVYNYGVRGFGVANAVAWTVLGGYFGATTIASSPDDALRCAIGTAFLTALFGTPIALGLGYWWGTTMAAFRGLAPDPRPMSD